MIRLHVLDDQVVYASSRKHVFNVVQLLIGEMLANRVQNCIGVICHAVFHLILTLKQVNLMIIHANVLNII